MHRYLFYYNNKFLLVLFNFFIEYLFFLYYIYIADTIIITNTAATKIIDVDDY